MKTIQEIYNQRLERLNKAIALGKPDRTPVILKEVVGTLCMEIH